MISERCQGKEPRIATAVTKTIRKAFGQKGTKGSTIIPGVSFLKSIRPIYKSVNMEFEPIAKNKRIEELKGEKKDHCL